MADQLATPGDLAALVQSDLDLSTATVVIEAVTAVVQEAAGNQRIVQVVDDVLTLAGTTDAWLNLPQIPVTAVSSVTRDDGTAVAIGTGYSADYKVIGNRLWCRYGWQADLGWFAYNPNLYGRIFDRGVWAGQTPSVITVTCTHGYPAGSQDLQLARAAALGIARGIVVNEKGATSEHIDDYSVAFEAAATRMEASPALRAALRRKYARRAAGVRIG